MACKAFSWEYEPKERGPQYKQPFSTTEPHQQPIVLKTKNIQHLLSVAAAPSPEASTRTLQVNSAGQRQQLIDIYLKNHMVDAHLSLVQTCRVCLLGFGFVAFCTSLGAHSPRGRLQCALTASACFLSSVYYTRLYKLRRLPVTLGYSMESNTVAESMRYANWTIVVALLGICAFLLRGPFEAPLVGPFSWSWWNWSYETWRVVGPLLSSAGTIVSLPGWHASRAARAQHLKGNTTAMCMWLIACIFFMTLSAFTSLVTFSVMLKPLQSSPTTARSEAEITLGRSITILWVAYPIISFARTTAIVFGAGDWGINIVAADLNTNERSTTKSKTLCASILCNCMHYVAAFIRGMFLAFVSSPDQTSSVAVARLYAMVDGVLSINEANAVMPLLSNSGQPCTQRVEMHAAEVTPLCSQGVDSILAIVDICSQALSALGCAALTLQQA